MMNFHLPIALFVAVNFFVSLTSEVHGENETLFIYQPVITAKDRVNSRGEALTDPVAILIQERANTHKNGEGDDPYFTTPARRAEITAMISRGDFSQHMKDVVLNGDNPVLFIVVERDAAGAKSMRVAMRLRDQDNFDEIRALLEADLEGDVVADDHDQDRWMARERFKIQKEHPDYRKIITILENGIERVVFEPVILEGDIYVFDGWARMDGNVRTKSGKDPIQDHTNLYFDLDYTAVLKKIDGEWNELKHVVAGDIAAEIDIPAQFPTVPKELFPGLPESVFEENPSEQNEQLLESYEFIITENDRRNSRGGKLTDPVLILMQDRANVHKFGNRERDSVDNFFSEATHRARIRSYLARGSFPMNLQNAVKSGPPARLHVSVFRHSDGRYSMHVGNAGGENQNAARRDSEINVVRYAFIDSESNFRVGPGTGYAIKFKPLKGTVGTLIQKKGNWIQIRLENGDSGWAHQQNLRIIR